MGSLLPLKRRLQESNNNNHSDQIILTPTSVFNPDDALSPPSYLITSTIMKQKEKGKEDFVASNKSNNDGPHYHIDNHNNNPHHRPSFKKEMIENEEQKSNNEPDCHGNNNDDDNIKNQHSYQNHQKQSQLEPIGCFNQSSILQTTKNGSSPILIKKDSSTQYGDSFSVDHSSSCPSSSFSNINVPVKEKECNNIYASYNNVPVHSHSPHLGHPSQHYPQNYHYYHQPNHTKQISFRCQQTDQQYIPHSFSSSSPQGFKSVNSSSTPIASTNFSQFSYMKEHIFHGVSAFEEYEILDKVGEGTFGEVHKARHRPTGLVVALKRILFPSPKEGFPLTALREIKILKSLSHPNIISLIDIAIAGTANILINNRGELKIGDFGLARPLVENRLHYTGGVVTRWYRAPELLLGSTKYGKAVDMWGVGCIILEMIIRRPVFPGQSDVHQLELITKLCGALNEDSMPDWANMPEASKIHFKPYPRRFRELFQHLDKKLLELLDAMLQLDPSKRPNASAALSHEYFTCDPLPSDPLDFSSYPSCHEMDKRRRDEEKRKSGTTSMMPPSQTALPVPHDEKQSQTTRENRPPVPPPTSQLMPPPPMESLQGVRIGGQQSTSAQFSTQTQMSSLMPVPSAQKILPPPPPPPVSSLTQVIPQIKQVASDEANKIPTVSSQSPSKTSGKISPERKDRYIDRHYISPSQEPIQNMEVSYRHPSRYSGSRYQRSHQREPYDEFHDFPVQHRPSSERGERYHHYPSSRGNSFPHRNMSYNRKYSSYNSSNSSDMNTSSSYSVTGYSNYPKRDVYIPSHRYPTSQHSNSRDRGRERDSGDHDRDRSFHKTSHSEEQETGEIAASQNSNNSSSHDHQHHHVDSSVDRHRKEDPDDRKRKCP